MILAYTGYCRRRGKDYPDGKSFIDEKDSCMNCTCLVSSVVTSSVDHMTML